VRSLDLIGAIELAYDRTKDEQTWLSDLTTAIAPAFGSQTGAPVTSFTFDLDDQNIHLGTTAGGVGRDRSYNREDYQRQHDIGSNYGPARRVYDCDMFTLLSRVVGAGPAKESIVAAGMVGDDALGLRANMTPTSGVILTTHVPSGFRIRDRELWTRFAAHVGSALRLRRRAGVPSPDSARAVLTPTGRLEHGNDEAIAAEKALAGAAKAIDRARGKLRRLDPEAASALWRTMVQGEWSLVDWYDHDGKRFLLAHENRVPPRVTPTLTLREEQIVACAAMGHSNKLIAYDLGVSTGSVSVILARAAKKLGVSSRVALVRVFKEIYER
jgi:DNA-binding CsgD family transcriptional regulator